MDQPTDSPKVSASDETLQLPSEAPEDETLQVPSDAPRDETLRLPSEDGLPAYAVPDVKSAKPAKVPSAAAW